MGSPPLLGVPNDEVKPSPSANHGFYARPMGDAPSLIDLAFAPMRIVAALPRALEGLQRLPEIADSLERIAEFEESLEGLAGLADSLAGLAVATQGLHALAAAVEQLERVAGDLTQAVQPLQGVAQRLNRFGRGLRIARDVSRPLGTEGNSMVKSVAEVRAELTAPGQLFEMDEVEIRGVPTRVWKNAPGTLRNVLDLSSLARRQDPRRVRGRDDLLRPITTAWPPTFAHRLIDEYGVQKGDRVALAMRNFPEWLVAFWGATAAGAIIVPLNAWWTGPELEYGIKDSGAKVLVADEERAQRLRPYSDLGLDADHRRPQRASAGRRRASVGRRPRRGRRRRHAARCRHRSRRRRHDLLHVGHHWVSRRARSAPTATSAPT